MEKLPYLSPQVQLLYLQAESRILSGSNEGFDVGNEYPGAFTDD